MTMIMRFSVILLGILAIVLTGNCKANLVGTHRQNERIRTNLMIQQHGANNDRNFPFRRVQQRQHSDDDDDVWQQPNCERGAAESSSTSTTCTCNPFADGVVELSCLENCIYCGDTESSSCGQFSFASNFTEGMTSNTMSFTTSFQYNGTGGRYELIAVEEIDCTDIGECSACRVLVNGTLCNSCTICSDGAIVDCENIVAGSSFNTCSSSPPPVPGLFEGFTYDVAECVVPPPPDNDNCTSAIPIVPGDVVSGILTGALEDIVPSCEYEAGTHGVWYSFQGTGTPVLVSTCSDESSTDGSVGLITVYQGSTCDLLECSVGSSQTYCPGYYGGSSILVPTEADTTYYVYVSGYLGSFGTFDLTLTTLTAQSNGQCSDASEISVDGSAVVETIDFSDHQRGRLPVCGLEQPVDNYGVAWYKFVAATGGLLRASTCASPAIGWMSTIAIASGDCDALSCVEQSEPYSYYESCSEGGTFVDFQVTAGTSYHVALWGSGYGDVGLYELDIRSLNPPANDNCENAQSVDVSATVTGTFGDVTLSSDESGGTCFDQIGSSNSGGIWYSFVGTGDILVATACSNDFTPFLSMHTGSCGDLQCTSPASWNTPSICSSFLYGQQTVPLKTQAGTVYYVLVSCSGPVSGNFDLSFRTVPRVENDSCMDALQIQADGQLIIGNTEGARYEDFNDSCLYNARSPGVWYVVAGNGGMLRADTCSEVTNFDTVISVYSGSCGDLECIGANDDGCGSVSSSITWNTEEGVTYYIRVSGLGDGQTGEYGFKVAPFVPAVNDGCDGAINLPIGGTLTGTMEGASGNNESYACYSGYDRPSLWYYIDGTGTALKVSTCSPGTTFYGGMQAFEGTTCSDLECVGLIYEGGVNSDYDCPYPSSVTRFFAEVGMRYFVLLLDDSFGGANSTFTLNVTEFEIAANDVCETAIPIAANGDEQVEGSTINSLPDNITCYWYSSNVPGVWYSVVGTGQALVASTCSSTPSFESSVYVFSGGCGSLECVAYSQSGYSSCGDSFYGSQVSFRTENGVDYYILVTGSYYAAAGDFSLSLVDVVPPPNDVCSDAIEITSNSGVIVGSLANATSFFGSNYTCAYEQSAKSVWYTLIGTGDVVAISTCSSQLNFDSAISVSTGSCDDHVCVTSNAYNSGSCPETSHSAARVTIRTEVGVEYFIAVEGLYLTSGGDFGLTVSTLQVPANDECPGATRIQPDAGTVTGSITNATGIYDYNSISCTYSYDAPDVWYSMIGTGEVYAVSTCSSVVNFDSSISISKGSCDLQECVLYGTYGNTDCPESMYSVSRAVFQTEVGVEYYIVVQGVNYPSEGEFTLEFKKIEPSANDECSGAIVIQSNDTTVTGSLANATGTVGFNTSCEFSTGSPGVWFSMIGTGDVFLISTCSSDLSFDAALSVSTGSCDDQICIATAAYNNFECSEGPFAAAEVIFHTEVGVEYFIQVQSLSSSSGGEFVLHLSTVTVPVNDVCTDAISIPVGAESISGSITNATGDFSISCPYYYNSPDVWYTLVGTGDTFAVTTCSDVLDFDAALSVSSGSCSNQECIAVGAYNDETCASGSFGAARVLFRTEVGTEYFIAVQGNNYPSEGDFELKISTVELPPNDECSGALDTIPGSAPIFGSTSFATYSGTNSSCSEYDTSPDLWYRVEGTGALLTASTCGGRTNFATQISIYEGIGEICDGNCIATNNDSCGGGSGSKVEWIADQGVTYYIRVHGYSTGSGSFVLRVT